MNFRYWIYDYNTIYEPAGTDNQTLAEHFARKENALVIDMKEQKWLVGRGDKLEVSDIEIFSEFHGEVQECLLNNSLG